MFIGDTLASTMVPLAGKRDLPNLTVSISTAGDGGWKVNEPDGDERPVEVEVEVEVEAAYGQYWIFEEQLEQE